MECNLDYPRNVLRMSGEILTKQPVMHIYQKTRMRFVLAGVIWETSDQMIWPARFMLEDHWVKWVGLRNKYDIRREIAIFLHDSRSMEHMG